MKSIFIDVYEVQAYIEIEVMSLVVHNPGVALLVRIYMHLRASCYIHYIHIVLQFIYCRREQIEKTRTRSQNTPHIHFSV